MQFNDDVDAVVLFVSCLFVLCLLLFSCVLMLLFPFRFYLFCFGYCVVRLCEVVAVAADVVVFVFVVIRFVCV